MQMKINFFLLFLIAKLIFAVYDCKYLLTTRDLEMSVVKYIFMLCFLTLNIKSPILAQGKPSEDSLYIQAISNTGLPYKHEMGAESLHYIGTAYTNYWHGVIGHPFFDSENFKPGNIQYHAVQYQGIPLLYDIAKDLLVSTKYASQEQLALPGIKILGFSIGQHQFVRLDADMNADIKTGFYEIFYRGVIKAYVKHQKEIKQSFKTEERTPTFIQYDAYFIEKNGRFHAITNASDIVSLLTEHQKEIRKKMKERDINFKKYPENCLIQIAAYYDTLIK